MIVCKIELWPGGDETKARNIGAVVIANVGGTASVGEYEVRLLKSAEYSKGRTSRTGDNVWKTGRVSGFARLRLGPYDLLYRALGFCVAYRNPHVPPGVLGDEPDAEATA